MQFSDDNEFVNAHVCELEDTTTWERFALDHDIDDNVDGPSLPSVVRDHYPSPDVTGFLREPACRTMQAITFERKKPEIVCLPNCPEDVKRNVDFLQQETFPDATVDVVSRTTADDVWIVHVRSDEGLRQGNRAPDGYLLLWRTSCPDHSAPSLAFLLLS